MFKQSRAGSRRVE